jgi:tetratricopeptide (TPR) repeat protein
MEKISLLGISTALVLLFGCAAFEIGSEMQTGRSALLRGDAKLALTHLQRAAQSNPDYLLPLTPLQQGVWTYVGRAHYVLGQLPEARQALEQARSRYEHDSLAKLYLGLTLLRQQREQKAERPLSLTDLQYALKEGVPSRRVAAMVRERGVDFGTTKETEKALRTAGADEPLIEQVRKMGVEFAGGAKGLRERGLKEVEAGMRGLHDWLEYVSYNTTYGKYWDPGREIRSQIQASLTMLSGREVDLQKVIAAGEWLGQRIEDEIDFARRDQLRESPLRRGF